jgi:hypothetical protein
MTVELQPLTSLQPGPFLLHVDEESRVFESRAPLAGPYRLEVGGLPASAYLTISLNGRETLDSIIVFFSSPAAHDISLVVRENAAKVTGAIFNHRGEAAPGAIGLLLPDPLPQLVGYFKVFIADESGSFSIQGIRPAKYQLFAFTDLRVGELPDPLTIQRARVRGTRIELAEGSNEFVQLSTSSIGVARG